MRNILNKPLAYNASLVRSSTTEQRTPAQVEALAALTRTAVEQARTTTCIWGWRDSTGDLLELDEVSTLDYLPRYRGFSRARGSLR